MNPRIRELAQQAGLLVYNPQGHKTKLEHFAELIVRDCVEVAAAYQNVGGNCYVDDMIAKHWDLEQ